MAVDKLHSTRPGEAAPTTYPGHVSVTRETDDITRGGGESTGFWTRRRVLVALGGGVAVAATVGSYEGIHSIFHVKGADHPEPAAPPVANPNIASSHEPIAPEKLMLNTIHMPETLDPATFPEVVANVADAVQFAVNHNDQAALARYIPGGETGVLLPGQFQLRAAFIDGFRQYNHGQPDDPNAPQYYPWGFSLEFIELATGMGFTPQDPNLHKFVAQVRLTMGDLPPLVTSSALPPRIEEPHSYVTYATFTRWAGHLDDHQQYVPLPNLAGKPGHGWGISNVGQMYPVPSIMTGQNLPKSFTEVPPVFNPNPPK